MSLYINKNDNIHKSVTQEIRWPDELWQNWSECNYYRLSYYVKTNLPKNHHSKNHDDKEFFHVKNGHNNRVATLFTVYLTVLGIVIPYIPKLKKRAIRQVRTDNRP